VDGVQNPVPLFLAGNWQTLMTAGTRMDACFQHSDRRSKTMTKSKTIVIWGSEGIFGSSIERFLAAKEDWKVVSISNTEDRDALILAVETLQPDIVIIHQGFPDDLANLALQLLPNHPAIKVIMVSLENNLMDVYSKQAILAKEASDLITVIENEP
jgi:chemotaxis response regulator CheB